MILSLDFVLDPSLSQEAVCHVSLSTNPYPKSLFLLSFFIFHILNKSPKFWPKQIMIYALIFEEKKQK